MRPLLGEMIPEMVLSSVDFPLARMMGVKSTFSGESLVFGEPAAFSIGKRLLKYLKIDALMYFNLQWHAVGDWNMAVIASESVADFFDIGLGFALNSIISSDDKLTTPHDPATLYHITYNETTGESDSSFYTFKGTKLMGRFSIDLKKIIRCMMPATSPRKTGCPR